MSKILIVDDSMFMRKGIRNLLRNNGFTDIIEAENGAVAEEQFDKHKPDLVIMDITMPDIDGLEALKTLRKKNTSTNFIMCSAMGQETIVLDALKNGAKDFIVKPYKSERLLKAVKNLLP